MNIITNLLTPGSEHGRSGTKLVPKGILVHYVGNPGSSAAGNRNWFEGGAGGAHTSAHYVIGLNGEIMKLVPENECAAHAGIAYDKKYTETAKTNNSTYIGIEVCHPDATGKYNSASYKSLIELCADICKRYGFDPLKDVKRHYDVTGKMCPLYYVNNPKDWDTLRNDIDKELWSMNKTPQKVKINGVVVEMDAYNDNETVYMSIRKICEALGKKVDYESSTKTIVIN